MHKRALSNGAWCLSIREQLWPLQPIFWLVLEFGLWADRRSLRQWVRTEAVWAEIVLDDHAGLPLRLLSWAFDHQSATIIKLIGTRD